MFKGSIVALITPFKNEILDEKNYIDLIHYHLKNGTHEIVPWRYNRQVANIISRRA